MRALTFFLICFMVGSYICGPISDPDLWWHIAIGRWIISHHDVPHVDYWNMFGIGHAWRAYSWSTEVLFAFLEKLLGTSGLVWAQLTLAIALVLIACFSYAAAARNWFIGLILGCYVIVACYNHLTLRPQALVWGLFALLLLSAERAKQRGLVSSLNMLGIVAIGCAWANIHLSAFLGLFAVVGWLSTSVKVGQSVKAGVAFFIGTLVTPYFGGEWITFVTKTNHPLAFREISEFQSATVMQYPTVFLVLLATVLITVAITEKKSFEVGPFLVCGGLSLVGLAIVKFLPFAILALGMLFAGWWRKASEDELILKSQSPGLIDGLTRLNRWVKDLSPEVLSGVAFVALSICVIQIFQIKKNPLANSMVPSHAVDVMFRSNLPHPWLNEFSMGGYLMYRLANEEGEPSHLVAIDGRTNVNPHEIWQMQLDALQGKENWRDYINKVGAQTILWRRGSAFTTLLKESKEWCKIYPGSRDEEDPVFMVFTKRQSTEDSCVER